MSDALRIVLDDDQLDALAERIAAKLAAPSKPAEEWLDSRRASEYLGIHRDTLRRLSAEGRVPSEQDAPGAKLYFRRSDLDHWRAACGGQDAA